MSMNMSVRKNNKKDKGPSFVLSRSTQFIRSTSVNKSNNHEAAKFRRKYRKTLENNKELVRSNVHLKKQIQELFAENHRLKVNQIELSNFVRRITKVKPSLSKVSNAVFSVVELLCGVTKVFDELCQPDDNPEELEVASNNSATNIPNQNPRLPFPIDVSHLTNKVKGPLRKKSIHRGLDIILENDFPEDNDDMEEENEWEEVSDNRELPIEAREVEVEIDEVEADAQNLPVIVVGNQEETTKAASNIDKILIIEVASEVEKMPVIVAAPEKTIKDASNIDKIQIIEVASEVEKMPVTIAAPEEDETQHQRTNLNLHSLLAVDENVSNIDDTNTDLPPMLFTERDLEHNPVPSVKPTTSHETEPKKPTPPQLLLSQRPFFAPLLENTIPADEDATEIYHYRIPEESMIPKRIFEKETNAEFQKRISAGPSFVPFQPTPFVFATHRPKFSDANKSMHDHMKKPSPIINETNHDEEDMELTKPINNKSIVVTETENITAEEAKNDEIFTASRTIGKIRHKGRIRKLSSVTDDADSDSEDRDPDFVRTKAKSHKKPQTKDTNFQYFLSKSKKSVPKNKTVKGKLNKTNNGKRKITTQPLQKDPNRVLDIFDLSHSFNKSAFVLPVSPKPKKSRTTSEKKNYQESSDEENDPNKTLTPHLGKKKYSKRKQQTLKGNKNTRVDTETASSSEEEEKKTVKAVKKSSRTKPNSKMSDKVELDFDTESSLSNEEKKTVQTVRKSSRSKPTSKVIYNEQFDFDTQSDWSAEEKKKTVKKSSRTKPNSKVSDNNEESDHIEPEKNTASESEEAATAVIKTAIRKKTLISKATPFVDKANIEGVKKKLLLTQSGKKHTEKFTEPPKENLPNNARESIPFENPQPTGSRKSEDVPCTSSGRSARRERINYALPSLNKKMRRD